MANKNKKEKRLTTPASAGLPAHIKQGEGGLKNINPQDVTLSFIKVSQALSPEVKNELIPLGRMFDNVTIHDFGKELLFIPLFDQKQAIKWILRKDGGGIDCISPDATRGNKYGKCLDCEYYYRRWNNDAEEKSPACTEYFSFPSLVQGYKTPVVVTFGRSMLKTGKKLVKLFLSVSAGNPIPLYSCKFKLFVFEDKSPKGEFFNLDITGAGFTSKEEYTAAEKMAKLYATKEIKIDRDEPEVE